MKTSLNPSRQSFSATLRSAELVWNSKDKANPIESIYAETVELTALNRCGTLETAVILGQDTSGTTHLRWLMCLPRITELNRDWYFKFRDRFDSQLEILYSESGKQTQFADRNKSCILVGEDDQVWLESSFDNSKLLSSLIDGFGPPPEPITEDWRSQLWQAESAIDFHAPFGLDHVAVDGEGRLIFIGLAALVSLKLEQIRGETQKENQERSSDSSFQRLIGLQLANSTIQLESLPELNRAETGTVDYKGPLTKPNIADSSSTTKRTQKAKKNKGRLPSPRNLWIGGGAVVVCLSALFGFFSMIGGDEKPAVGKPATEIANTNSKSDDPATNEISESLDATSVGEVEELTLNEPSADNALDNATALLQSPESAGTVANELESLVSGLGGKSLEPDALKLVLDDQAIDNIISSSTENPSSSNSENEIEADSNSAVEPSLSSDMERSTNAIVEAAGSTESNEQVIDGPELDDAGKETVFQAVLLNRSRTRVAATVPDRPLRNEAALRVQWSLPDSFSVEPSGPTNIIGTNHQIFVIKQQAEDSVHENTQPSQLVVRVQSTPKRRWEVQIDIMLQFPVANQAIPINQGQAEMIFDQINYLAANVQLRLSQLQALRDNAPDNTVRNLIRTQQEQVEAQSQRVEEALDGWANATNLASQFFSSEQLQLEFALSETDLTMPEPGQNTDSAEPNSDPGDNKSPENSSTKNDPNPL